jgi:hypothetical protein
LHGIYISPLTNAEYLSHLNRNFAFERQQATMMSILSYIVSFASS